MNLFFFYFSEMSPGFRSMEPNFSAPKPNPKGQNVSKLARSIDLQLSVSEIIKIIFL